MVESDSDVFLQIGMLPHKHSLICGWYEELAQCAVGEFAFGGLFIRFLFFPQASVNKKRGEGCRAVTWRDCCRCRRWIRGDRGEEQLRSLFLWLGNWLTKEIDSKGWWQRVIVCTHWRMQTHAVQTWKRNATNLSQETYIHYMHSLHD